MALYGLILFIIYGWVEFEAMAIMVDNIGGLLSFLGIFATAIVGIQLLRSQSAQLMASFRRELAQGQLNADAIAGSVSVVAGAILMLLPGYVTDFIGICCFIPGLRTLIGRFLASRMNMKKAAHFSSGGFRRANTGSDEDATHFFEAMGQQNSYNQPQSQNYPGKDDDDDDIIEGEFKEKN